MAIEALGEAEPLIPTQDEIKILENRQAFHHPADLFQFRRINLSLDARHGDHDIDKRLFRTDRAGHVVLQMLDAG